MSVSLKSLEQSYKALWSNAESVDHFIEDGDTRNPTLSAEELKRLDWEVLTGLPPEKLGQYNRSFTGTALNIMKGLYPATMKLIPYSFHNELAEYYRRAYPTRNPVLIYGFEDIPQFIGKTDWLKATRERFPFLEDLARLEWIEIALRDSPDLKSSQERSLIPFSSDWSNEEPLSFAWNPALKLESFDWNLLELKEKLDQQSFDLDLESLIKNEELSLPSEPEVLSLISVRHPETFQIKHFKVNLLTIILIDAARQTEEARLSWELFLQSLYETQPMLSSVDAVQLSAQSKALLAQANQRGWILGRWSKNLTPL